MFKSLPFKSYKQNYHCLAKIKEEYDCFDLPKLTIKWINLHKFLFLQSLYLMFIILDDPHAMSDTGNRNIKIRDRQGTKYIFRIELVHKIFGVTLPITVEISIFIKPYASLYLMSLY